MDKQRKNELKEAYRNVKTYMGVVQIRNSANGKIFIAVFPNLKNKWMTMQGQLGMGMHYNAQLQKDWREFGPDAFSFDILEQKETEDITDMKWEMKQMLKPWLEKLQPYGDRGYNTPQED